MDKKCLLCDLAKGESGIVKQLLTCGSMRRRLQDVGIVTGTRIECLQKSPCGDPVAYLIRGAVIALRCEDSANIIINTCR